MRSPCVTVIISGLGVSRASPFGNQQVPEEPFWYHMTEDGVSAWPGQILPHHRPRYHEHAFHPRIQSRDRRLILMFQREHPFRDVRSAARRGPEIRVDHQPVVRIRFNAKQKKTRKIESPGLHKISGLWV